MVHLLPRIHILIWQLHQIRFFFFFNDTATTEIYTLSLHDALPISTVVQFNQPVIAYLENFINFPVGTSVPLGFYDRSARDRKSTRLNSSHGYISYADFCLKKKNNEWQVGIDISSHHAPAIRQTYTT